MGRKDEIKRQCISLAVGKFVRRIEATVRQHKDRGRPISEEAKAVLRKVIQQTAEEALEDSAVFLVDEGTPVPPTRDTWGPATPVEGYPVDPDLSLRDPAGQKPEPQDPEPA